MGFCLTSLTILNNTAFIDWAKHQIESYAEMFRKQVYSSDVEPSTVEEALRITYNQSKKVSHVSTIRDNQVLDPIFLVITRIWP